MEGFGTTLLAAFGLMLVIEGLLYALFPRGVLALLSQMRDAPEVFLRRGGVVALIVGTFLVWLALG